MPLLIAPDGELVREVDRLAAAAGCELRRVDDLVAARSPWSDAPLVLLDSALLATWDGAGLPRRAGPPVQMYRHRWMQLDVCPEGNATKSPT